MSKIKAFWNWKQSLVVLASAAIIVGIIAVVVSISSLMQGPTSAEPPNAAEWLSALSTFWGAVATAIGAVMTGGALLVAAFTYKHQVDEKNRAAHDRRLQELSKRSEQARAVKLIAKSRPGWPNQWKVTVRNDSRLPIDGTRLRIVASWGVRPTTYELGAMAANGGEINQTLEFDNLNDSFLFFMDSNGIAWRRYFVGELVEQLPSWGMVDDIQISSLDQAG